ncbi:hypothetical protein [Kitasatospora cineracea]|uniref:hypothetical protein n=1 Tax=Kitasatospora cineracea TaxID=88074 RepID=UPI0037FF1B81
MVDKYSDELGRISSRPSSLAGPVLVSLEIEPIGDIEAYGQRLRQVLMAAANVAHGQRFDREVLDSSGIPSWFAFITDSGESSEVDIPAESLRGRERYYEDRGEGEWDLQEWLFCFDPDLRRWLWWDLTTPDGRKAVLWIDTRGEPVIPCEELWWAVFAVGARSVRGPVLTPAEEWQQQSSIGIR